MGGKLEDKCGGAQIVVGDEQGIKCKSWAELEGAFKDAGAQV